MRKHKRAGRHRLASLKLTILAILLVVIVPTLVVVSASLYSASRSYYESSMRQLLESARTVARSALSELELTVHVLHSLSQLQVDTVAAAPQASALQRISSFANGRVQVHALQRHQNQWRLAADSGLPPSWEAVVEHAATTGRWQVSDIELAPPGAPAAPLVLLAVPRSVGNALEVSTLITTPADLLHALSRHSDDSTSVILAITDGQGHILERSVDGDKLVGKVVPDWPLLKKQTASSGAITAQTIEGSQIIFAYQRIEGTPGWVAVVGEDAKSFNQRAQQPIQVMVLAAMVTICLALGLGLWLARKALKPIEWLAVRAQRIAAGQMLPSHVQRQPVPSSFVAEFEVLRQSLDQADEVLQQSLTESRTAEQQAQAHLGVLQAAEEQARIGHWSLDAQTGLLHCSDMIAYLFGHVRQAMVMRLEQLSAMLKPESFERMQAAAQQCLEHGTPYAIEIEHMREDGSTFFAYLRGWPVRDQEGHIVSISGTLQDVSEGKEQRERLQALADNLPSGAIFRVQRQTDRVLRLQFLSAGLETLTGLSTAALLAQPERLLHCIRALHMRRLLRVLLHAQRPGHVLDEEFALHTQAGTLLWLHCRAALRQSPTGGVVWDGIVQDVTAAREAQAALHAAKDAAQKAERAKSDFLATMSHEIRTPMNSVIGMARLALRTDLQPKQRNYLEKINESANVLLGIINDILDFSKIEAGGLVLEGVPFQIEALLQTVSSVTALKAEEKGLEITFAVDPDVPATVRGDVLRLGQVLTNLVSNAIKFTHAGGVLVQISKHSSPAGQMLHFAVTDTGIGLSEEQMHSLFQPFTQAQTDISRRYGGTGLGLAISKRLVEMMGGQIGVRSTQGQGSCFFFEAPLPAVSVHAQDATRAMARASLLRGKHILIADDSATARAALAAMAQSLGMQVTQAVNGQDALQALEAHKVQGQVFDVVVLDWRMPVMDGVQTARLIKADTQLEHMPAVLMVTAYGQEAMLQACDGIAVQGVLLKPVTPSAMFNTLLKACVGLQEAGHYGASAQQQWLVDTSAYAALKGKCVLVADDNALNREVASDFLAVIGVHVMTAEDGRGAIALLEQYAFDAVLMDIHMPHMDGLSATRYIRSQTRWRQLPVIALTAQALPEDVQQSLDAGMNGHLSKPIDETALYSTLLEHCTGAGQEARHAQSQPSAKPLAQPTAAANAPDGTPLFARLSASAQRRAQLLQGFLKDVEDFQPRWRQLSAQGDWLELAAMAHKIKGSASYLDADALVAAAQQLEDAASRNDGAIVHAHEEAFLQLVQACVTNVQGVSQALQSHSAPAATLSAQALFDWVERIKPLVAAGNFAAHAQMADLVQSTQNTSWAAQASQAAQALDDLEYAQALQHLHNLQSSLAVQ